MLSLRLAGSKRIYAKLPCKTLTATIRDAFFGSFRSRFPVSNTSIPARLLRVALWTTPNAPRPSSSSYSICSGSISHLSRGTIWRCERAVLEENQQLILQIQLNSFLVFLFLLSANNSLFTTYNSSSMEHFNVGWHVCLVYRVMKFHCLHYLQFHVTCSY